mmetsp:Transcript_94791/g.245351  ORF Transcript_94791/g.245351 Transcript_94791/m.245351 type:complete len:657 (+) Transcript_94791:1-1971(+)
MGQASRTLVAPCYSEHRRRHRTRTEIARCFEDKYGVPRPGIEHVVVLMLENRTFDNIFGCWMDRRMQSGEVKPSRWDVHAKRGRRLYEYTNRVVQHRPQNGAGPPSEAAFPVWSRDPAKEDVMAEEALGIPNGDPAEKYALLNRCVFEDEDPEADAAITLGGFAQQYYEREMHDLEKLNDSWGDRTDFEAMRSPAMHVYLPEQAHVFTELAEAFGVSDTYFASAPCQTWPNRLFASTGHCYGYVNNLSDYGEAYDHDKMNAMETMSRVMQFNDETVFDRLLKNGVEWAVFYGDYPLSVMLNGNMHDPGNVARTYPYQDFDHACKSGSLPPFTWIEPQYLKGKLDGSPPTDMHPPHNILYGQNLVAEVYNSLRGNEELWKKTLLLVTCDEGVGIFDHVPPPKAPDPKAGYSHHFYGQEDPRKMKSNPFKRYGTRVPLLMASPFLEARSVVRPSKEHSKYPFDHCSIIRTVFDLFVGPDCHLTNRDKLAPSLLPSFLHVPRSSDLGPERVTIDRPMPEPAHKVILRTTSAVCRGGCHSVMHLVESSALSAENIATVAKKQLQAISCGLGTDCLMSPGGNSRSSSNSSSPRSDMLPRTDTQAVLGGDMGQGLAGVAQLMMNFGKGARAGRLFHWQNDGSSVEDSGDDSSEDSYDSREHC